MHYSEADSVVLPSKQKSYNSLLPCQVFSFQFFLSREALVLKYLEGTIQWREDILTLFSGTGISTSYKSC